MAIVEGEEDRNGFRQRRSVVDDEARDFAMGIDRGVFLALLLIVAQRELAKLVVGPDFCAHALHRARPGASGSMKYVRHACLQIRIGPG